MDVYKNVTYTNSLWLKKIYECISLLKIIRYKSDVLDPKINIKSTLKIIH